MSSLTQVAYTSRNVIKYGGIGLVGFLFLWWGIGGAIKAYQKAHPPYVAPTVRWGVIDKVFFPEKEFQKKEFVAELPNDTFPKYQDQAKVYFIYRSKSIIGALEEGKKTAALMGFVSEPKEVGIGVYLFNDNNTGRSLTMNVLQSSFKLSYPYLTDQLLLNPEEMPDKETAINTATNFLEQIGKMDTDLAEGEKKVSFWKINFDGLKEVPSLSEANIIRIDFFRKKLAENIDLVSAEVGRAPVSVLVSGSSVAAKKIVEVNYQHVKVDTSDASSSTYPIISSQEAFDNLKMGNYWPASDTNSQKVTIRKIYLAYFEPVNLTQFMQPVYVFEGDGGFVAYVRAINDSYAK
jgi:hypothetical protein